MKKICQNGSILILISNLHEETSLTSMKYLFHEYRKQENKHLHPLRPPKGGLTHP